MGLHRVEANIQPANHRSAGLVRSLGFVHEGFSRDFLHLPGVDGRRDWRDHDRFTMLSTDWPAAPYRPHGHRRIACVVSGSRAGGLRRLRRHEPRLGAGGRARHPALLVIDRREHGDALRAAPRLARRRGRRVPAHRHRLRMGLARAGFEPSGVPVLEGATDVSRREVVRHALAVRAAHA